MNVPLHHKQDAAFLKAVTRDSADKNLRPLNLLLQAAAQTFSDYLLQTQDMAKREQLARQCRRLAADILLLDTDNADALNLLARLALDENAIEDARFLLARALDKHPGNPGCHYSYGHVMLARKQYQQAVESFQQAIDHDNKQLRFYTSLAYTLEKMGNYSDAATIYRRLRTQYKHDAHINSQLIACLHHIDITHYDTSLEEDLLVYLDDEKGDLQYLAKPISTLLSHKYLLTDPNSTVAFEKLINDELLLAALPRVTFTSPQIENLLVLTRKHALELSLYSGEISAETEQFVYALALHNINNGYIHPQSMAEQSLLEELITSLHEETRRDAQADIGELFLLACMYRHPAEVAQDARLSAYPSHWRDAAQNLWLLTRSAVSNDESVPVIPNSHNRISLSIRAQYEHAPYPQWQHLHHRTPTRYRDALLAELSGFVPPAWMNGETLQILVAGCGTGRQAVHIAKYFTQVEVTAIDLSQNSLRHAHAMARKFGVENIRFYQGDILDLNLNRQFHIIECSGVLHHIQEEQLAMQKLLAHLRPDGLLKLGLYSARARTAIAECRRLIHTLGLSSGIQDVRDFRQLVLIKAHEDAHFLRITESPDFYSYSGCVDLLFNAYERHYEPGDLQNMLMEYNLHFHGFSGLQEIVRRQYRECFGDDPDLLNLDHWDMYEQQHPDTFAGMYQFYVSRTTPC